jgi:hypothetical protein
LPTRAPPQPPPPPPPAAAAAAAPSLPRNNIHVKTAIITKRKRPAIIRLSFKSPVFKAAMREKSKHSDFNADKLKAFNDEWFRFALTNVIMPGMALIKVEHQISQPPKPPAVHNRPINKFRNARRMKRRSTPYFRSNHYKTIWLENRDGGVQEVMNTLHNPNLYPMYLTFQRWANPTKNENDGCNPPPAKRIKIDSSANGSAKPPQCKNDVISLLDSSEEEEDGTFESKVAHQTTKSSTPADFSASYLASTYVPPSDPAPPLLRASDNGDFVLTPYGAGKIISSRVERHASTSGCASIHQPTIIYTIDLHFGICHVPSNQLKTLSGTTLVSKPLLTYGKVPITAMDLLRLRPMTYLNDSIVNFYLKYLKAQCEKDTSGGTESGRGWDDLNGDGVFIFPSFCYNRIVNILGNDNRNTKPNRIKIMNELKSWTKGTGKLE